MSGMDKLAAQAVLGAAVLIRDYCRENFICDGCPLDGAGLCSKGHTPQEWKVGGKLSGVTP